MIKIRVARRADGMLDYVKEGPGYRMPTVVPPVYEKLEAQLAANNVFRAEREKLISEVNAFGTAVISFPARYRNFRA
jgi:hypothetical protein